MLRREPKSRDGLPFGVAGAEFSKPLLNHPSLCLVVRGFEDSAPGHPGL